MHPSLFLHFSVFSLLLCFIPPQHLGLSGLASASLKYSDFLQWLQLVVSLSSFRPLSFHLLFSRTLRKGPGEQWLSQGLTAFPAAGLLGSWGYCGGWAVIGFFRLDLFIWQSNALRELRAFRLICFQFVPWVSNQDKDLNLDTEVILKPEKLRTLALFSVPPSPLLCQWQPSWSQMGKTGLDRKATPSLDPCHGAAPHFGGGESLGGSVVKGLASPVFPFMFYFE